MKKVFLLLIIFITSLFAWIPCSWPISRDNFNIDYQEVFNQIKANNQAAKKTYQTMKNNQIKNILTELENKNRILENIKTISKTDALTETEELHLIKIKKELKSLLIDTWGEE